MATRTLANGTVIEVKERATKKEMEARRTALIALCARYAPATVRGIYYRASVDKIVDKTDRGYGLVQPQLVDLRENDEIPYNQLVDPGRNVNEPLTFTTPSAALDWLADVYREPLWRKMPCELQFWMEKTALEGVIDPVTREYDVPLFVAKGFSSVTFLKDAADRMSRTKPVHLYYLHDADDSGLLARFKVEETLRAMAPDVDLHFHDLGLWPDQALNWPGGPLPWRDAKETTHREALRRRGIVPHQYAWELEAIPPDELRAMVQAAIDAHMPDAVYQALLREEEVNRQKLRALLGRG